MRFGFDTEDTDFGFGSTTGATPPPSNWILSTGVWNDSGVWDDTQTWND